MSPTLSPPLRMMSVVVGARSADKGNQMETELSEVGGVGSAPNDRELALVQIMARLAAADGAAVYSLRERFRPELVRAVRAVARTRGARLSADDLEDLITDVAVELARLAPSWDPLGAPPWVWARHRVASLVDRHVGQWTRPLDEEEHAAAAVEGVPTASAEAPLLEILAGLAHWHPEVALLREAVARVATDRDQVIFFETAVQVSLGDRSPAVTVAGLLGIRPEAVRQQHRRVRLRVQRLAAEEPRFATLAALPVVA